MFEVMRNRVCTFSVYLILSTRHPIISVLVSLSVCLVTPRDDTVQECSLMVAKPSSMFDDAVVSAVYTKVLVLQKQQMRRQ